MPGAVIFDVDGTLVDTVDAHARAWQQAFGEHGHAIGFEAIRAQIGKGGDQLMPVFLDAGELDAVGEALEQRRGAIFRERYLAGVQAFGGVRALFERLRDAGVQVALASSAKGEELEAYKRIAGIADLTEVQTTSEDAEKSKPHPDIFEAALSRLPGIAKADIIVVGDTPYDAEAASRAGLRCIGVLSGGFAEADLRRAGCIAIFGDAAELLARFEQSPLA